MDSNTMKKYVYEGPYPEATLHNALGDGESVMVVRGEAFELPAAIGDDMVKRGKIKAAPEKKKATPKE